MTLEPCPFCGEQCAEIEVTQGMKWGIHIIPINDFREHRAASDCWCNPTADEEEPSVIIHHALDKREFTIEKGITQ